MVKGRLVAVLVAVATLACGVSVPAAQADELSDLKAAAARAKSAYDKAVSDRDALKPARDKAQATLDEGSIGYFRTRGADGAVRILTDPTVTQYTSEIGVDKRNTATSLDSMVKSLSYIREMNGLREGEGQPALKVADGLMAVAQAHWDHGLAMGYTAHWHDFNVGENIACWSEGFYEEKKLYEQTGATDSSTGHYRNVVNPDYVVTGWAGNYQEFDSSTEWVVPSDEIAIGDIPQGRVMSVDDYEADVKAYKDPLDKAVSDYDTAAKTADDAKNAYDKAEQAVSDWTNATFTVTFDTAGGTGVEGQKVRRGAKATKPADPTRSGHTFDGWYNGDAKYDFSTPVTSDITLTAHWKSNAVESFTVTFEPDNGQPNSASSVAAGRTVGKPTDPTRSGHTFDGWYNGDAKYDFSTPVTSNITLTARWTKVQTPATPARKDGWVVEDGTRHWYENGRMVRSHAFYDKSSDAWYWADADGSIARDKDVFIPRDESDRSKGGKWVRFDKDSRMVKGEQYSTKAGHVGWYWFDRTTGEMAKGMRYIPSNGGKWVYYDATTGIMAHGERYVDYDRAHTGWYRFDPTTGAMAHGDMYVGSNGGKWVRYDRTTGIMVHGLQWQDGSWYYFNQTTGAMAHGRAWVPEWRAWHDFDRVTGRG